jgi:hypothetical protein
MDALVNSGNDHVVGRIREMLIGARLLHRQTDYTPQPLD